MRPGTDTTPRAPCAPTRVVTRPTHRGTGPVQTSVICACGTQTPWRVSEEAVTETYAAHLADRVAAQVSA